MEYINVGKVKDAHGLKGELYLILFSGNKADWLGKLETLVLTTGQESKDYQEWEIEKAKPHKKGFIAKLKGCDDRNQSEEIKGQFLHIPKSLLTTNSQTNFYLAEILNFSVRLTGKEMSSTVEGFSSNGIQDLMVVKTPVGSFEVPLVDAFIVEVNYEQKFINIDIPEGLVEWE